MKNRPMEYKLKKNQLSLTTLKRMKVLFLITDYKKPHPLSLTPPSDASTLLMTDLPCQQQGVEIRHRVPLL